MYATIFNFYIRQYPPGDNRKSDCISCLLFRVENVSKSNIRCINEKSLILLYIIFLCRHDSVRITVICTLIRLKFKRGF